MSVSSTVSTALSVLLCVISMKNAGNNIYMGNATVVITAVACILVKTKGC